MKAMKCFIGFVTITVLLSPATLDAETITVRALIDGISQLHLSGSTASWHHLKWQAPGLFNGANEPTVINGVEWYAVFDSTWCNDCWSDSFRGVMPALAASEIPVSLTPVEAREAVSIIQQPSASNDYELVVEFNDDLTAGADWYEVVLEFDAVGSPPGSITTRVSVASDGTEGNDASWFGTISADGRSVAFASWASNLIPGDSNGVMDYFVHDRYAGETTRVSVASDGAEADGPSGWGGGAISADGQIVAFQSGASNLVPEDTSGLLDVFVHDRLTGETTRASIASDGTEANSGSWLADMTGDGRFVLFFSDATNLVAGDTNGQVDLFVRDRLTGTTTRVNVASDGTQANDLTIEGGVISEDGRTVVFHSYAANLVAVPIGWFGRVFVHDRLAGETTCCVDVATEGTLANDWTAPRGGISVDGRAVLLSSQATNLVPNDTNGAGDAFVRNRLTGETTRVSVAGDGAEANGWSSPLDLSSAGRFVVFHSSADNLVPDDTNGAGDCFVHDRSTGQTIRISVDTGGTGGDCFGFQGASIGDGGRIAAFVSSSASIVPGDTNDTEDVFVRSPAPADPIGSIGDDVEDLVDEGILTGGQGTALLSKLDAARAKIEQGNLNAAIGQLNAFVNQVEALVLGGTLTEQEAAELTDAALLLIQQLEQSM